MPRWADDTVRIWNGWGWQIGQDTESLSEGSQKARRAGGPGWNIYIRNNKKQSIGLDQSLTEVGTPPPHNLVKLHGMVAIKKQQQMEKYNDQLAVDCLLLCYLYKIYIYARYWLPFMMSYLLFYYFLRAFVKRWCAPSVTSLFLFI